MRLAAATNSAVARAGHPHAGSAGGAARLCGEAAAQVHWSVKVCKTPAQCAFWLPVRVECMYHHEVAQSDISKGWNVCCLCCSQIVANARSSWAACVRSTMCHVSLFLRQVFTHAATEDSHRETHWQKINRLTFILQALLVRQTGSIHHRLFHRGHQTGSDIQGRGMHAALGDRGALARGMMSSVMFSHRMQPQSAEENPDQSEPHTLSAHAGQNCSAGGAAVSRAHRPVLTGFKPQRSERKADRTPGPPQASATPKP